MGYMKQLNTSMSHFFGRLLLYFSAVLKIKYEHLRWFDLTQIIDFQLRFSNSNFHVICNGMIRFIVTYPTRLLTLHVFYDQLSYNLEVIS